MKLAIASGKGGTGKTTLSVAIAIACSENIQLLDCDVEEPNCHIFLPVELGKEEAVEVLKPVVEEDKCIKCGRCAEICQFNAIVSLKTKPLVFPELCHSCGGCTAVCPTKAIREEKFKVGVLQKAVSGNLEFVSGKLDIGQAMAIPVIKAVKREANPKSIAIFDAPPGTSCPFIETVSDADFVLLVTEPTPFGRHDLTLAVETVRKMGLPFAVVVNRINSEENMITDYCKAEGVDVFLQIAESRKIAEAYSRGESLVSAKPEMRAILRGLLKRIREIVITNQTGGR